MLKKNKIIIIKNNRPDFSEIIQPPFKKHTKK